MKKRISFIIAVAMVLTCFWGIQVCEAKTELTSEKSVNGAEVPETPTVKATVSDDSVKLTVSKTSGADGYGIYMKAPGAKKYSLIKTLFFFNFGNKSCSTHPSNTSVVTVHSNKPTVSSL